MATDNHYLRAQVHAANGRVSLACGDLERCEHEFSSVLAMPLAVYYRVGGVATVGLATVAVSGSRWLEAASRLQSYCGAPTWQTAALTLEAMELGATVLDAVGGEQVARRLCSTAAGERLRRGWVRRPRSIAQASSRTTNSPGSTRSTELLLRWRPSWRLPAPVRYRARRRSSGMSMTRICPRDNRTTPSASSCLSTRLAVGRVVAAIEARSSCLNVSWAESSLASAYNWATSANLVITRSSADM